MPDTFVLDCSVAAKWVLPEPGRATALAWFDRYASGDIVLIAPDLLLAEFASLLAKRTRRKQISADQARLSFGRMTESAPLLYDTRPRLFHALDLSLRHHLSLWDCVYIALAEEHDCQVLTADARLFRGATARHNRIHLVE